MANPACMKKTSPVANNTQIVSTEENIFFLSLVVSMCLDMIQAPGVPTFFSSCGKKKRFPGERNRSFRRALFELQLLNEIFIDFFSICQSRIFWINILHIHHYCVLHHFLLIIFDVYII
jgi:hypothetical protein